MGHGARPGEAEGWAAELAAPRSCEAQSSVTLGMGLGSLNSCSGRDSAWPSLVPMTCGVGGGGGGRCQRHLGGPLQLTCSGCLV